MGRIVTIPADLEARLGIFSYGDIPGLTALQLDQAVSYNGFDIENMPSIQSIVGTSMTDIDPAQVCFGYVYCSNLPALTNLDLSHLVTVFGGLTIQDCPALNIFSMEALVDVGQGVRIVNTGYATLAFLNVTNSDGFDIEQNPSLSQVVLTNWATGSNATYNHKDNPQCSQIDIRSITALNGLFLGVTIGGTPNDGSLTTVLVNALQSVSLMQIQQCMGLTSLSFPSLGPTSTNSINISFNHALTTVSMPNWTPNNGQQVAFIENALSAASVNHILARCVANPGYVSGPVALYAGTNAAPTGQGITDKNTLIGRGCSVVTN